MKISVFIIATNKYREFIKPLIGQLDKYFLPNSELDIHVFQDQLKGIGYASDHWIGEVKRSRAEYHWIPSYKYPEATLLRYHIMTSISMPETDYSLYIDADMGITSVVGDEILGDIVAVRHPGYYNQIGDGNNWEKNTNSCLYLSEKERTAYYAGGIHFGKTIRLFSVMNQLKRLIDVDLSNGIVPQWHDETAWNFYLNKIHGRGLFKELSCEYCCPEDKQKRIAWGLEPIEPKIIALEKNFEEIRK